MVYIPRGRGIGREQHTSDARYRKSRSSSLDTRHRVTSISSITWTVKPFFPPSPRKNRQRRAEFPARSGKVSAAVRRDRVSGVATPATPSRVRHFSRLTCPQRHVPVLSREALARNGKRCTLDTSHFFFLRMRRREKGRQAIASSNLLFSFVFVFFFSFIFTFFFCIIYKHVFKKYCLYIYSLCPVQKKRALLHISRCILFFCSGPLGVCLRITINILPFYTVYEILHRDEIDRDLAPEGRDADQTNRRNKGTTACFNPRCWCFHSSLSKGR